MSMFVMEITRASGEYSYSRLNDLYQSQWAENASRAAARGLDNLCRAIVVLLLICFGLVCLVTLLFGALLLAVEMKNLIDNTDPEVLRLEQWRRWHETGAMLDRGDDFVVSNDHLLAVHKELSDATPANEDGWVSGAASGFATQISLFEDLISRMENANERVRAVVQTQAGQVEDGKSTLGNVLDGLGLAIPVAQTLWFSGPVGPALSYQYQLATSSAAMGTTTGTANGMHDNAEKNAASLDGLAQEYHAILTGLSAMGQGVSNS